MEKSVYLQVTAYQLPGMVSGFVLDGKMRFRAQLLVFPTTTEPLKSGREPLSLKATVLSSITAGRIAY